MIGGVGGVEGGGGAVIGGASALGRVGQEARGERRPWQRRRQKKVAATPSQVFLGGGGGVGGTLDIFDNADLQYQSNTSRMRSHFHKTRCD